MQSVCVEPPPLALNMTRYMHLLLSSGACSMAPVAIDQYLLRTPALSTANPPAAVAAVDRWDRHTDGRTDARPLHKPCSAYYASRVNKRENS